MMPFRYDSIFQVSRRFVVLQRRWMSNSADIVVHPPSTTTNSISTQSGIGSSNSTSAVRLISRQLFVHYQQYIKLKRLQQSPHHKKPKVKLEDTPWPRNIVYGAYGVGAICVPYSIAWFLSTNEPLRTKLFPNTSFYESFVIIEWMRYHFGILDTDAISEPETIQQQHRVVGPHPNTRVPYKFVDEPTKRIRQQQLDINQQQERNVKFRIQHSGGTDNTIVELPAKTLARYDTLVKAIPNRSIVPPIALDFIYDEEVVNDDEVANDGTIDDNTVTVPSMSIFSLWHYQPSPKTDTDTTFHSIANISPLEMELLRVQYEIDRLQHELNMQLSSMNSSSTSHHQRPIDDIQDELVQLRSLKRKLQWKKWIPFGR
jgi:hypothetical protein